MITVGYGMHRNSHEIVVAKMMEELSAEPYENLTFLNLDGKDWAYLNKYSDKFAFDIHAGVSKTKIVNLEEISLPPFPSTAFFIFSSVTGKKFLPILRGYLRFGGYYSDIVMSHKNKIITDERKHVSFEEPPPFNKLLEETRKYGIEKKLVGVELINATKRWQIEGYHKPLMKKLLQDLNTLQI